MHDAVTDIRAGDSHLIQNRIRHDLTLFVGPVFGGTHTVYLQIIGCILDKDGHHMRAGRCHCWVDLAGNQHVDIGLLRNTPGLPVVIGKFKLCKALRGVHVSAQNAGIFWGCREIREAVERDIQLRRRPADFEVAHGFGEILGQFFLIDMMQDCSFDIHVGRHDRSIEFGPVFQSDTRDAAVSGEDLIHSGTHVNCASMIFKCGADCGGDGPHTATREAPCADAAVDVPHVVVQQDIGRAWGINTQTRTDDPGPGQVRFDQVIFKMLIKKVANRHGPKAQRLSQLAVSKTMCLF